MNRALIDKCPHCGSDAGFYTKDYLSGTCRYNRNFDGSEAYNGEMYEYLSHEIGKIAYCVMCDKRLFKMPED